MIKKVIFLGGSVLLVGLFLFGRDAVSYVSTSAGSVKDSVHESVPIEFQIERARNMIKDLVPEVRKNMHIIAKEEVEVKRLEEQIAKGQANLEKEQSHLMRLKSDLASGKEVFRYAGRNYTTEQVRTDLANRFERYKTSDATLASLRQISTARQRSLEAARQKLEGMLASKRQLEVEIENLEARVQMLAANEATSEFGFDDTRLGRVKELVQNLKTRLDVADRLMDAQNEFQGEIPLDSVAPEDICEQVTEYFHEGPSSDSIVLD